jgi:fumarate hydratase class II
MMMWNKSQSLMIRFPTGMHIAIYKKIVENTMSGVIQLETHYTTNPSFKEGG